MHSEKISAVGMLSGGLDSTLAAKILIEQGIEVHAVNFVSPFCTCTPKSAGCASVIRAVEQLGDIPLKRIALGDEYLAMVRAPRFGYGRGMNPCIDCRIMKIRKAAEYMREIGASFLFTGEVLGQRPMSQHREAMDLIDKESGIQGYIVRPLSATLMSPTVPEQQGLVDRKKLLDIQGRSRKPQMALAQETGITDYPCPAGGCLLTDGKFAERLRDHFSKHAIVTVSDVALLKTGRHLPLENGGKAIIARNEHEGEVLLKLARNRFPTFTPVNFSGPVVVLEGTKDFEIARKFIFEYGKPQQVQNPQIQEAAVT